MEGAEEPTPVTLACADREAEVRQQVDAARLRLRRRAGFDGPPDHFRRPLERVFTAEERGQVTILFGGLTPAHETLIQAALQSCGQRAEPLPQPDLDACLVGRQFGNNGVCNPAYFTVGNLVKHLQALEAQGMSRADIIDRYVFFTAGGCGPCRYGMYEDEYRLALRNAGFEGFRVLLFAQTDGIKARTGELGFQLSLHLGLSALNGFTLADTIRDFGYAVRPFESVPGSTNAAVESALAIAAGWVRGRRPIPRGEGLPRGVRPFIRGRPGGEEAARVLVNIHDQLWGADTRAMVRASADAVAHLEVDRLRVKPVVKVIGEFWAQTTESAGNFNMLAFLEREGAQVMPETLSSWVLFLLSQARTKLLESRGLDVPTTGPRLTRLRARLADDLRILGKLASFAVGNRLYRGVHERLRAALGGVPHQLVDPVELAELARPFYHELARGGESYLEVGKHIYYARKNGAHMVLSLKPFGCMPSMQSDGVQSLVMARFRDSIFLPIETSPDGEIDAHSRVQVALLEARSRAQAEFQQALQGTGKRLEDIQAYVAGHPELRRATYSVPHREGVAGTAASFVWHVSDRMDRERRRFWRRG
ncbi:MAG: activator of (R)-2-hydroxyglutaryl-CoA dehydratase [Acidobacteria bacterium]|nr:activator of (R)-2-hydroxyglutaryl-CoA dehydratase [Acidobacteriota bacterium]